MQSVTSNAVFENCLQVEKVTGTTLVGGGTYTIQKVGKVVTLDITGMNIPSSVASNQVVVQLPERFIPNVTFSTVGFCGNGSLYFSATLGFQIYGKTATSVKGNVVVYPYMDLDVYLPQLHAVWIVD